jgi:hypothetical protein
LFEALKKDGFIISRKNCSINAFQKNIPSEINNPQSHDIAPFFGVHIKDFKPKVYDFLGGVVMRIIIQYAFAVVALTFYGGQV